MEKDDPVFINTYDDGAPLVFSPWEPCHRRDFFECKLSQSLPAVDYVVGIYMFR